VSTLDFVDNCGPKVNLAQDNIMNLDIELVITDRYMNPIIIESEQDLEYRAYVEDYGNANPEATMEKLSTSDKNSGKYNFHVYIKYIDDPDDGVSAIWRAEVDYKGVSAFPE